MKAPGCASDDLDGLLECLMGTGRHHGWQRKLKDAVEDLRKQAELLQTALVKSKRAGLLLDLYARNDELQAVNRMQERTIKELRMIAEARQDALKEALEQLVLNAESNG